MTTAADDRATEDAFEALLAGRPVPEAAAGLAAFTGAVRGAAASPGRPSAALADLLSTGLLTDQSSPSARTAPTAGTARSRGRTRRRFTMIVPVLVAKFLSAGAVAQAAAGAGVVVVVAAGAGSAGVLPGGTQEAFSDLTGIGEVTQEPTEELLPPAQEGGEPGGDDASLDPADPALPEVEVPEITEVEEGDPTDAAAAAAWAEEGRAVTSQEEFKAWLARGSENGWVTGQAVSAAAHARNEARKAARGGAVEDGEEAREGEAPEVEAPEVEAPEVEAPEVEAPEVEAPEVGSADDDRSQGGKGKGKGRG